MFGLTDKLSQTLQKSSLSAAEGRNLADTVVQGLNDRRGNGDLFFQKVLSKASELGEYIQTM